MIKKIVVVAVLIAILCTMASARTPQVGDKVRIAVNAGNVYAKYIGNITDIENGFICLKCSEATSSGTIYVRPTDNPVDACIGIGAIIALTWL